MNDVCTLCPRHCGKPRPDGFCGAPRELQVASVCIHRGEEPPISGDKGIVNIFFAHCNLQCIYCQNWQISGRWPVSNGQLATVEQLADHICQLTTDNQPLTTMIGFVTAAHYIDRLPDIVEELRHRGLSHTIVYNSSGYESVEALQRLEGYVDVYLPDLKYMDSDLAARYSHAPDYPQVATKALMEMRRQVGCGLKIGDDGLAYRGMLVRHLVLPDAIQNAINCLDWLADNMSPQTGISLMAQYFPPRTGLPTPLDRKLTQEEYNQVLEHLNTLPFSNVWTQEICAQDNYQPDFNKTGNPFE